MGSNKVRLKFEGLGELRRSTQNAKSKSRAGDTSRPVFVPCCPLRVVKFQKTRRTRIRKIKNEGTTDI